MKKLILLLAISTVLFGGIFKEINDVKNPNGKPFTLNISAQYEFDVNARVNANMPITSWFTIKGGFFLDRYKGTTYWSSSDYTYSRSYNGTYDVFYLGGELHLPIYKLWEK